MPQTMGSALFWPKTTTTSPGQSKNTSRMMGRGGKSVQDDVIKTAIPCFPFRILILFSVTRLFSEHRCEHEELFFVCFCFVVVCFSAQRTPFTIIILIVVIKRSGRLVCAPARLMCAWDVFTPKPPLEHSSVLVWLATVDVSPIVII